MLNHRPKHWAAAVGGAGLLWVGLALAPAAAAEMNATCGEVIEGNAAFAQCNFRLTEREDLERLVLSVDGAGVENPDYKDFAASGLTSAWLFLIDRSNPRRAQTVERNVALVREQLKKSGKKRLMGVATFASDLQVILDPASTHRNRETRLASINADGVTTEFYASTLEAIKILKAVEADRRALVIMSDGKAEDTAYDNRDVVMNAKAAGITVFGLGFAATQADTVALQGIRRLAEETGGISAFVVGNNTIAPDILNNLTDYLENGGVMRGAIDGAGGPRDVSLDVTTAGGENYSHKEQVVFSKVTAEEPAFIVKVYQGFGAGDWAEKNESLAWAIPVILLLLIAAAAAYVLNQRRDDRFVEGFDGPYDATDDPLDNDGEPATRISEAAPWPGYFEVVGNESVRYEIHEQSLSIGRHSDNDIQLMNDSVHRHHAHFHISPGGEAMITDLDTANGVLVNGERQANAVLESGDMVELGEVRLRYVEQ